MGPAPASDEQREAAFWGRVQLGNSNECWPWLGLITEQGYGKASLRRGGWESLERGEQWTAIHAHRQAWIYMYGDPGDLTIDHLCHNRDETCEGGPACPHRRCVNPAHLEAVPGPVNTARGQVGINQRRKTHCPKGHPYSGDNLKLYDHPDGYRLRICRECWLERNRVNSERYSRKKGIKKRVPKPPTPPRKCKGCESTDLAKSQQYCAACKAARPRQKPFVLVHNLVCPACQRSDHGGCRSGRFCACTSCSAVHGGS